MNFTTPTTTASTTPSTTQTTTPGAVPSFDGFTLEFEGVVDTNNGDPLQFTGLSDVDNVIRELEISNQQCAQFCFSLSACAGVVITGDTGCVLLRNLGSASGEPTVDASRSYRKNVSGYVLVASY